MIRLATFAPEELNLNGDQGNLLALSNFLSRAGYQLESEIIEFGEPAKPADFYLIGHGSEAANAMLSDWLKNELLSDVMTGKLVLAVGSSALVLANLLDIPVSHSLHRVSEFQVGEFGQLKVLGYRNSVTDLENIQRVGSNILTMLHGPVLAKNPALLELLARESVASAGEVWPATEPSALVDYRARLGRIAQQIWQLEAQSDAPRFQLLAGE